MTQAAFESGKAIDISHVRVIADGGWTNRRKKRGEPLSGWLNGHYSEFFTTSHCSAWPSPASVYSSSSFALYVPKFWRVTPDSFNPVVKISGLDVTQAWSLSRTALRQEKEGQPELAFHAWQAAVANYPTHIGYIRSAIANTTLQSPGDSKAISAAIKNSVAQSTDGNKRPASSSHCKDTGPFSTLLIG